MYLSSLSIRKHSQSIKFHPSFLCPILNTPVNSIQSNKMYGTKSTVTLSTFVTAEFLPTVIAEKCYALGYWGMNSAGFGPGVVPRTQVVRVSLSKILPTRRLGATKSVSIGVAGCARISLQYGPTICPLCLMGCHLRRLRFHVCANEFRSGFSSFGFCILFQFCPHPGYATCTDIKSPHAANAMGIW